MCGDWVEIVAQALVIEIDVTDCNKTKSNLKSVRINISCLQSFALIKTPPISVD